MHDVVLVLERADKQAPEAYLEHVLKTHNSAFGAVAAALAEDKEGAIVRLSEPATLEYIKGIRGAYPNVSRIYSFIKADGAVHADDLQPFTLLIDEANNPLAVVCVNGGSDQYQGPVGSALSPAFFYSENFLTKFVGDAFDTVDNDLTKLEKFLSKESIVASIVSSFDKKKTSLLFLLADKQGSVRTICSVDDNPDNNVTTDWGWTSSLLGWKEKKADPAPSPRVSTSQKNLQDILKAAQQNGDTAGKTADPPKDDKKDVFPKGATPDTNPEWFFKADAKWDHQRKHREYETICGRVPNNYKQCPTVQRLKPAPIKSLTEGMRKLPQRPVASTDPIPQPTHNNPPFLTADQTKALHDKFVLKYYTMDGKQVGNPWDYLKFETEYPKFTELTNLTLDGTINMSPDARHELMVDHPEAMVNWTIELTMALRHAYEDMARLKTELEARILKEKDTKVA